MREDRLYGYIATRNGGEASGLAVALRHVKDEDGELVVFYDTNRDRVVEGPVTEDGGGVWVDTESYKWEFRIVTLERFNSYWIKRTAPWPPFFQTDEEMHAWYVGLMKGEV